MLCYWKFLFLLNMFQLFVQVVSGWLVGGTLTLFYSMGRMHTWSLRKHHRYDSTDARPDSYVEVGDICRNRLYKSASR